MLSNRVKMACIGIGVLVLASMGNAQPPASPGDNETADANSQLRARALVSLGDPLRIHRAMAKAMRGERVVVGVIGGSITAGASATSEENRWGNRVAQWWTSTFPKATIEFVNAGIGATASDLGAHRVGNDLLSHKPDFVVVEYAVNDAGNPICVETFEGLVRQILDAPNRPGCMVLYTMHNNGENRQAEHERVARHYGLPAVSFRDALWPEVESGRIAWSDIEADEVHPNDRGHAYCADFLTDALEKIRAGLPEGDLPEVPPLPQPLSTNAYQFTRMLTSANTEPVANNGWKKADAIYGVGPGWTTDTVGATLEFEVEGTAVAVVFYHVKGDVGIAEVRLDGGDPVELDAYFPQDWGGGYTPFRSLATDLNPGVHRVSVRLLDKTHPDSHGHAFTLVAICAAGTK